MLGLLTAGVLYWLLARRSMSLPLMAYLAAILFEIPILWGINWWAGDASRAYFWAYVGCTGLILLSALWLALMPINRLILRYRIMALALLIAVILSRLAYHGIGHGLDAAEWVILCEATVLMFCGILVGATAAYSRRADIGLILMTLWFTQAAYQYGYLLHLSWEPTSWTVKPWIAIGGFLLLGWRLNPRQRHPAQPLGS